MVEARRVLVQGASRGLGLEFVAQLLASHHDNQIFATCRDPEAASKLQILREQHRDRLLVLALDVTDEPSIADAISQIDSVTSELDLVLNVAGVLHGPGFSPEKKLDQVDPEALRQVFEVNAFGPLLVAKHVQSFLRHERRSVFASLSARIGSIGDNRLGGWYAYRGSKAAQNMFTKTLSIELARIAPRAIAIGLHPGTVDTDLSKPFQRGVPDDKLFSTERSATALLGVIDSVTENDSGKVFDFAGIEIPP